MTQGSNKPVLIGFGILLGLLFALVLYLFFENWELKKVIENQQNSVETAAEDENYKNENPQTEVDTVKKDVNPDAKNSATVTSEQGLWQATKKINSFDGYLEYIKSEDDEGIRMQESISKLLELGTSGWLYSGRSSDDNRYKDDQLVEVLWRKDSDKNLRRALPKKGDIVQLISKQARRTYPNFLPRNNQNGIWPLGKSAYVIDTRMEGNTALILKVVYQ